MTALAALAEQTRTLAPGMVDVRGWEIRALVDDVVVGSVHDLLLDAGGRVRWLDLALQAGQHVLFPAGQGRADERRRCIWLPGLSADQVAQLPTYAHAADALDASGEAALLDAYEAILLRASPADPGLPTAAGPAALNPDEPRLDPRGLFPWEVH